MGLLVGRKLGSAPFARRIGKATAAFGKIAGLGVLTKAGKLVMSDARHFHYLQRRHWNLGVWQGHKNFGQKD
jgi:hypothetical protein